MKKLKQKNLEFETKTLKNKTTISIKTINSPQKNSRSKSILKFLVSFRPKGLPSSKFQWGAGQPVPARRFRPPCGPNSHPQKVPAIILGTESHGENSKEHNYPRPQDYSLYYEAHQRISQPPQETTRQAAQPNSRPATWAVHAPEPNGANESHRRVSKPDRKTIATT